MLVIKRRLTRALRELVLLVSHSPIYLYIYPSIYVQQNVSVSITKELQVYINDERISSSALESTLKSKLAGIENPTIILRAEEGVPIEKAVNVMDIANRNRYKIVLAVKPE